MPTARAKWWMMFIPFAFFGRTNDNVVVVVNDCDDQWPGHISGRQFGCLTAALCRCRPRRAHAANAAGGFPGTWAVPPPSSWPPKNFDVMALVFTTCLMAVFWPYRHVILLAVGIYYLGRGWFWLCRNYPRTAWFVFGFLQGLLGGGRRRKGGDFQNPEKPFSATRPHPGELAVLR